jgi:hypothetical protein
LALFSSLLFSLFFPLLIIITQNRNSQTSFTSFHIFLN